MLELKKCIPLIAAILLVVAGLLLTVFQKKQPEQFTYIDVEVFDTVTLFMGYADSQASFDEQALVLKKELARYHEYYTIYSSYDYVNNLRTINLNAGVAPVKVDQEIIDLLKFSIELYHKTDGEINIAMGSVLSIWHNYRTAGINEPENAKLPSMEELQEAAKHTDINQIIIDEEASTVYLADPEMSLDVGSIGKGYAVQKVAEYARELGYNNLVINCGGNVATVGPRVDDSLWTLGIQNPDLTAKDDVIKRVAFSDKCLVTSGDYQRYYTVDGVQYCHIIDPDTLMPANYFTAVSIISSHSGMADALSTALFNMTYEEGLALINGIEDAEAIWIFEDGTIKYSEHFEDYIIE